LKSECPQIRELLSEYMDGVLEAPTMTAVNEHLKGCLLCSREHEALRSLVTGLRDIPVVNAPDNFLAKVHEKIEKHSMLERLRKFFFFTHIRIPVEAAAFALTAVLILSIFYFFPAQEKVIINPPLSDMTELKADQENPVVQNARDKHSIEQPVETKSPASQTPEKRISAKLSISLTTTQSADAIPSQSVSYGNSGAESLSDDLGLSSTLDDSAHRTLPIEVNSKIDEMIKSVGGTLISRDYKVETGYPRRLTAEIPAENYHRFISEIETLGGLKVPAPEISSGSAQDKVFIQMEFTSD
jgi:hypothetical protein